MARLRLEIPHTADFSKNKAFFVANGRFVSTGSKKRLLRDLEFITRAALNASGAVFKNREKVWLNILVEKLNHRRDAINVIDILCDGIKKGLGIDDRYYCIDKLDWCITPSNPKIIVEIFQED